MLVISATDDQEVNERVARAAAARGLLCNVVDQPALCNFITPALLTRYDDPTGGIAANTAVRRGAASRLRPPRTSVRAPALLLACPKH